MFQRNIYTHMEINKMSDSACQKVHTTINAFSRHVLSLCCWYNSINMTTNEATKDAHNGYSFS